MKVDSQGNPVGEGTWGIWAGRSARVDRITIDPVNDSADQRQVLNDGGYIIDLGADGIHFSYPGDFTAVDDPSVVLDSTGRAIKVGDEVEFDKNWPSDRLPIRGRREYTVLNTYPVGTLKGSICLSLWDPKDPSLLKGGAPDGYHAIQWSTRGRLTVVGSSAVLSPTETAETIEAPGGEPFPEEYWDEIRIGDWIEFEHEDESGKMVSGEVVRRDPGKERDDYPFKVKLDAAGLKATGLTLKSAEWWVVSERIYKHRPKASKEGSVKEWETPAGMVRVGSRVIAERKEYRVECTVLGGSQSSDGKVTLNLQFDKWLSEAKLNNKTISWYASRIVEVLDDEDEDEFNNEGENEVATATEKKAMTPAQISAKFGKVEVERAGTQIVLPDGMGLRTAIAELQRQAEQEEMDVNIMEPIHGFCLDAAHAFVKALEKKYGWINAMPTPGFFGPTPPTMIGVQVDPDGRTVQIPWGSIGIPGVSGKLKTSVSMIDGWPVFTISGTIKQKDKAVVNQIAQMAREYLKDHSIYKGKAIRVTFPEDMSHFSPLDHQPKFINTTDVRPDELIFSKEVEKRIRVNVWTPIAANAAVRTARVPLKRGVLLYGRYGVGKTLLAAVTARMSVQNGITFIDLADSKQLPKAIQFARSFGGMVVIFAEDIDRCDENGTRTDAFNDILNTVDGLTSKTDEILIVYTTNHIERISKAMLRQGRIDKVIHIPEPNAEAVERLIRLYARHMLSVDENIRTVSADIASMKMIPAAIREIVEQSKLAAIERGDVHHITAEDLAVTVEDTKDHNDLLKDAPRDDRSELEKAADLVGQRIAAQFANVSIEAVLDSSQYQEEGEISEEPAKEALTEETRKVTRRRTA